MSRYANTVRIMTDIVNLNVNLSPQEFVSQCDEFMRYPVATLGELIVLLKCLLSINLNNHSANHEIIYLIMGVLIVNKSLWTSPDNTNPMKKFFYCILFKIFELEKSCQLHGVSPELTQKIQQMKHICVQNDLLAGLCCHDFIAYYFKFSYSSHPQTTEFLQFMHESLMLSQSHPTTLLAFRHNIRNIFIQMRNSSTRDYPLWQNIFNTYMQKSKHICCMSFVKKGKVLYPCMNPPVTQWCRVHEKRRKKISKKLCRYTNLPFDLIRLVEYYGV